MRKRILHNFTHSCVLSLITFLLFLSTSHAGGPPPGKGPGGGATATKVNCNSNLTATWIPVNQMKFGTLLAGLSGGTLNLSATTDAVTPTGTVTAVSSFVTRGAIEVSSALNGCDVFPLIITYTNATITETGGTTMAINKATFVSEPAAPAVSPLAGVITTIYFGANLTVAAGQASGAYTGPVSITVKH